MFLGTPAHLLFGGTLIVPDSELVFSVEKGKRVWEEGLEIGRQDWVARDRTRIATRHHELASAL